MEEQSNNRVILRNDVLNYLGEQVVLNSDRKTRKKTPVDCQGHRSREQLVERPWLQLMCYTPVSGREVGCIFQSSGSRQDGGSKRSSEGVGEDKI